MKIKIYILTWQDEKALDRNLTTLFEGFSHLPQGVDIHVNVINNHSNFSINPVYQAHVKVIHNAAQPDFATAMLARMWNTAIIHGFRDLKNPDADIVVTAQDDTLWERDWIIRLLAVMEKQDFYADDAGDMVCAYTPNAIKKIGMWDERFHYGFGEGDYFLRAVKYLPDRSSINDFAHGRVWNTTLHLAKRPEPNDERYIEQGRSHQYRGLSWANFLYKWRYFELESKWHDNIRDRVLTIDPVPATILYPYFEMDVEDLEVKGYIVP
jgi:hypothetical protein